MKIEEVARLLVLNGVSTSIHFDTERSMIYLDLNTHSKSHLYLYEDGMIVGRYEFTKNINLLTDDPKDLLVELCELFKWSLHYRGFGNTDWFDLCEELGINF